VPNSIIFSTIEKRVVLTTNNNAIRINIIK